MARRFPLFLALLCLAGLLWQGAYLLHDWRNNPFALVPIEDAEVAWSQAGAIARGEIVGATPFLSAPLYLYFLGLIRALGGGLGALYAVQAVLRCLTAWYLGRIGRERLGPAAGWAAAACYLLLDEPVYYAGRVLNVTLQSFLAVCLWWRLARAEPGPKLRSTWFLGLLLGLNCLANPPMLLGFPILALWLWWQSSELPQAQRAARVALAGAAAALAVAPATLHNWLACGEFIPISAQAGVTFSHGNAPGADGVYHPIAEVSAGRARQNLDAYDLAARETGRASWRGTSSYFFRRGLRWWGEQPGAAFLLEARKARLLLFEDLYGDVYIPSLERQEDLASPLFDAALPASLVVLPGLLGLALLAARRRGAALLSEWLVVAIPAATVLLFFYAPRYRAPALAPLALGAVGLLAAWRHLSPVARRWPVAGLAAAALGAALAVPDFRPASFYQPAFQHKLGECYEKLGRMDDAIRHYAAALRLGNRAAQASLGHALRRGGDPERGLALLREAAANNPGDAHAHLTLAVALAENGLLDQAEQEFLRTLEIAPNEWQAESGLGNVWYTRGLLAQRQNSAQLAAEHFAAAGRHYQRALQLEPGFSAAWFNLGVLHRAQGQADLAAQAWEKALQSNPGMVEAMLELAWLRATAAEERLRDGTAAESWARRAREIAGERPDVLEVLAAARAERGDFRGAAELAASAQAALRAAAAQAAEEELRSRLEARARALAERLELYRAGVPYRGER